MSIISLENVILLEGGPVLNWEIHRGQQWLIKGDSEYSIQRIFEILSGKSKAFSGSVFQYFEHEKTYYQDVLSKKAIYVNFLHPSTLMPDAFYQQRYHASESETGPTLRQYIESQSDQFKTVASDGPTIIQTYTVPQLLDLFNLSDRMDDPIIRLSTGEFRKLAIVIGLMKDPELLLLNEPYAGLDIESIDLLDSILLHLSGKGLNIILSSSIDHYPLFVTNILNLALSEYTALPIHISSVQSNCDISLTDGTHLRQSNSKILVSWNARSLKSSQSPEFQFKIAFSLQNLNIHNGPGKILNNISWTVQNGEKWALLGRNGAGKSMLLSVIFADHPQAYSNHIILFDKLRGTGESIWEIREKIAYFSSELFLYADKSKTCRELGIGQIKSNPYRFGKIAMDDERFLEDLLNYFSLGDYIDTPVLSLPSIVQRLIFLLSIFMKNAPLIILDEPFHGFDLKLIEKLKDFISQNCKDRTIIFVTHRKFEIPSIIDQCFKLAHGSGEISHDHR